MMTRKRKASDNEQEIKNSTTFGYKTLVSEIPKDKLLILDDYAFDITELDRLPEKDLFTNMHTHTEFSEKAKASLLQCKLLKEKAIKNSQEIKPFPDQLLQDLYHLGLDLLTLCNKKYNIDALKAFCKTLKTDYPEQNEILMRYFVIKADLFNKENQTHTHLTIEFKQLIQDLAGNKMRITDGANWIIQVVRMQKPTMVDENNIIFLNTQVCTKPERGPIQHGEYSFFTHQKIRELELTLENQVFLNNLANQM